MRIVGGDLKGRRLDAPRGKDVRPTSSLARESLFNLLSHGRFAADGSPVVDAVVLDAFAGSGANGLEALSRGAARAYFLENHKPALDTLRRNIAGLALGERAVVLNADVQRPPRAREACDLVIMDPPYAERLAEPALRALAAAGWIAEGALVIVEMAKTAAFEPPDPFAVIEARTYGRARIAFLQFHRT